MFQIIELVVIAGLVGSVLFGLHKAWDGFKTSIAAPYVQAQIAADQPKIDAAAKRATDAETAAQHARDDTAACVASAKSQSDQVAQWQAIAASNAAAARTAKLNAAKAATAAAPVIADLQAKAAAAPKLQSCEQERDLAKCTLSNELRRRRNLAPIKCDS